MKDPKNCPCCGGVAELKYGRTSQQIWAYVQCNICGLHTKNVHGRTDKDAAILAIDSWNRRES